MPKRPAAHAEAMREQILEGARRAFVAGGYRGTSVPVIAAEAGVSVGLIYRYFPSKEELFLELCLAGTPEELAELAEHLAPIKDPIERLRVAIGSYFDALFDAIGAPLVLQALSAAPSDERVRASLVRRADDLRSFSAAFVRDAIARGEIDPDADVGELALISATLLDGALVAVAEQGDALDRDALRDLIVRAIAAASGLRPATRQDPDPMPMPASRARPARTARTAVVVPVRSLEGAKSRLGEVLDAEERRDLIARLLRRTVDAALRTADVAEVVAVSPDPEILDLAVAAGARGVIQRSAGLNPAIREARDASPGAGRLLVLPADIPGVSPEALAAVLAAGDALGRPSVVLAPDRHARGTNALLLEPPDIIEPAFGIDSRAAHARLAASAGAAFAEVPGLLGLDVDTPDDLLAAESDAPEAIGVE